MAGVSGTGGQPASDAGQQEAEPPQPVYQGVEEWVTGYFLPVYRRPLGGEFRWCRQWWRHAEAITRLTALWHAWEVLRLQPGTGMAAWLRDYLDNQLPVLLGRSGPFARCSEDEHFNAPQAVSEQPPVWWWNGFGTASRPGTGAGSGTAPESAEMEGRTETP